MSATTASKRKSIFSKPTSSMAFLRVPTISSFRTRPTSRAGEVEAFSPEYQAEPQLAHLGGADGLDLVRRILRRSGGRLSPKGNLIVEIGTGQAALEASRPDLPFLWLDTEKSSGEVFALAAADLKQTRAGAARDKQKSRSRPGPLNFGRVADRQPKAPKWCEMPVPISRTNS